MQCNNVRSKSRTNFNLKEEEEDEDDDKEEEDLFEEEEDLLQQTLYQPLLRGEDNAPHRHGRDPRPGPGFHLAWEDDV